MEERIIEIAKEWAAAHCAVGLAQLNDPTYSSKLNRLSEAEDALMKEVFSFEKRSRACGEV